MSPKPTGTGDARATAAQPGRALLLVENLSVPFDRRVWQEARALHAAGWEVEVICPRGDGLDLEPEVRLEGITIHRYPVRPAQGAAGYFAEYGAALWHLLRLARRVRARGPVDVVHLCNPPDLLFIVGLMLKLRGTRVVYDMHDLGPELYLSRFRARRDLFYWATRVAEWLSFRTADIVISTNESYRSVALTRGGFPADRVFVVRSAPAPEGFAGDPGEHGLAHGKDHLICYLGVMGKQDGVHHAVEALEHLARRRDDWHAVFIGPGDTRASLRQLALELGIADRITFTGPLPHSEVWRYLAASTVCLACDPFDAFNDVSTMNKIMEYMAVGRPVVCFDLTEARVSAGGAAAYARPNSSEHFGELIDELLDDPERRAQMGDIGRERVTGELSWSRSAQSLLSAYSAALSPRRGTRRPRRPQAGGR